MARPTAMIRRAGANDHAAVVALLHAYFAEWDLAYREDEATVLREMTHPTLGYFLAERDEESAGCVLLRPLLGVPSAAECKRLYVRQGFRGQGIAGALMDAAEAYAQQAGLEWIYLDSKNQMTTAIAMYRRRGYEEIPRFNDNAEATIFFRKRIR